MYTSLFHKNEFMTNFKEKTELLNTFFANRCTLLNNSSLLPMNLAKLTSKPLDSVNFSTDDISRIVKNLDPNKAHGRDTLSISMIKFCRNSICKPLTIIFNDCLNEGKFATHCFSILRKIIDLFPYFQFAAKLLSVSFITNYSPFLLIIS